MTVGKTYKFALDNIPVITTEEWAEIEAAAKVHSVDRRYPEIIYLENDDDRQKDS